MAINDTESSFVSLSYESYLHDTLDSFKAIKTTENYIYSENETFEKSIKIIKSQYNTLSSEEDKTPFKTRFIETIKNWFTKIWIFICDIFSKIYEITISLVKSLIIYIQKKKLQAHSIIKLLEKQGLVGYNMSHNDIIKSILKKNVQLKFIANPLDNGRPLETKDYWRYVNARLTTDDLKTFINNSVIIDNAKSVFSTTSLNKYLNEELLKDDMSEDKKLTALEMATDELYADAVFSNEVDPQHSKNMNILKARFKEQLVAKDITGLSHNIVFGMPKYQLTDVSLVDYFGLTDNEQVNLDELRGAFLLYVEDTKLVLGEKGYLNILQEVLKRYKERTKKDNENIKLMKTTVLNYMNNIGFGKDDERIQNRCKRFTNIVLKVKNIKNHFIRLRQTMILDIITLFSFENQAWYILTGNAKNLNNGFDDTATFEKEPVISTRITDSDIQTYPDDEL
jgi:hypothetical protein